MLSNSNRDKDKQSYSFKEWLEVLQQESWQLELLISGFAIFLLVQTKGPIEEYFNYVAYNVPGGIVKGVIATAGGVLSMGRIFLIINLILHVIFRGLWIATIGLRYVSGDIDWDTLGYSPSFTKYLSRKVGDFDSYIEKLEKICSAFFAFSFIIVFCLVSAAMALIVLILLGSTINWAATSGDYAIFFIVLIGLVVLTFFLGVLVYFIDFVTFGLIKKWEAISVIYLPMYRFYSTITLSFLYRPLIYNMLDNKFGKRLSFLFVPYIAIGIFVGSLKVEHKFFKPVDYTGIYNVSYTYYEDQLISDYDRVGRAIIPSMEINGNYLNLFIRIIPKRDKSTVELLCPDFEPYRKNGLRTDIVIKSNIQRKDSTMLTPDQKAKKGLECWSKLYDIYLDSSIVEAYDMSFYRHPRFQVDGVLCMIPIDSLEEGKHYLEIDKRNVEISLISDPTIDIDPYISIPFWKQ